MIYTTDKPTDELKRSFEALWATAPAFPPMPPLSEWLDSEFDTFYAFESDPETGACNGLCLISSIGNEPWVYIYVSPEHRRRKIATHLLDAVKENFPGTAFYYMSVMFQSPEIEAFLKSVGFQVFTRECIMRLEAPASETEASEHDSKIRLSACTPEAFKPIYSKCFDLVFEPDEGNYFFIQDEAGRTVGGVALTAYMTGWFLFDLCILPKYRRKGYAAEAIHRAFSVCTANGAKPDQICLHVSSANKPAFTLYEKLGFTPAQETILYTLPQ
ncbi:MAG: GNAT family N-acetyltransferase [Lachnospiraceae bacterium]|nr:GNAT family N-acetyltransferase [Lachnospiraceae bacterium]